MEAVTNPLAAARNDSEKGGASEKDSKEGSTDNEDMINDGTRASQEDTVKASISKDIMKSGTRKGCTNEEEIVVSKSWNGDALNGDNFNGGGSRKGKTLKYATRKCDTPKAARKGSAKNGEAPKTVAFEGVSPEDQSPPRRGRQWTAALIVNLVAVCAGTAVSWSSPTLPVLQGGNDVGAWAGNWTQLLVPSQPLTSEQGAVIAALVPLGALVGALPAGVLARREGCRRPLLVLGPLFTIGWVLILLAGPYGIWLMVFGRGLHGIATGAATVLVPLYCDEVAEVAIRGALGALLDLSMCNGVLLAYALALGMPYALLTMVCACVPIIFTISFSFMPESPVHLARVGRRRHALRALAWLRPGWGPQALEKELATLTAEETPESERDKKEEDLIPEKEWKICAITFTASNAKAVFVSYSLMFLQQASAISAVIAYSTTIFEEEGGLVPPRVATVVLGTLQSAAGVLAAVMVERVGRRPLLVVSTALVSASLVTLALVKTESAPWMPPVALGIYIYTFEFGIGPLPWFITAELVGPTASGGAVALNWASATAVTMLYPSALEAYGARTVFAGFAVMAAVAMLFSLLFVPETRGKTRAQLRREMRRWPRRPRPPQPPSSARGSLGVNVTEL